MRQREREGERGKTWVNYRTVQHEKIKKCRENLYCACSEMVTFAYWFFFYIS